MPLEPRIRRIVALYSRLGEAPDEMTMADRRTASAAVSKRFGFAVMAKGPDPARQQDLRVPVDGGQIRVRIYRPHGAGPFPLHIFLHGGGWCVGTLDERDARCRAISAGAGCVVASVDYRMAPENQYPTPGNDCYAALEWLVEHAAQIDADPKRLAIGGESAGGNLAAVACLMAKDRSGPSICHQWLDVPATDLTMSQPSVASVPDGHLLDQASLDRYLDHYLPGPSHATDRYASPLLVDDLAGLPPAWIMSAEFDKLRDDGKHYADALAAAGVPVSYQLLRGHVHPTFAFTRLVPSAATYEREAIAALSAAFDAV